MKLLILLCMTISTATFAQVYNYNGEPSKIPCNQAFAVENNGTATTNSNFNCCVKVMNNGKCKYHVPSPNSNQCPGGFPDEIQHPSCPSSSNPMTCSH